MKAITTAEEFFEYRGIEKATRRLVKNLIKESNGKLSYEQALEKARELLSE